MKMPMDTLSVTVSNDRLPL